jgi:hypothetical protein
MANTMNTSLDPRLFDVRIGDAYLEGVSMDKDFAPIIDQVEHNAVSPNDPQSVRSMDYSGLGPTQLKGETTPFPFDQMNRGYLQITSHNEYGLAVGFSRKLRDDDRTDIVVQGAREVGKTPNLLYNYETAKLWANGFNTTYFTAPDGLALFSTAHTSTINANTRANCLATSGALNMTNVQKLLTVMGRQTNMRGDPTPAIKNGETVQVIHQQEDEFEAAKLFHELSLYDPTNDSNSPNTLKTNYGWNRTLNHYINATGAGGNRLWFIAPTKDLGIQMVHRFHPEKQQHIDPDTDAHVFKVYLRFHNRIKMWERVYASGN